MCNEILDKWEWVFFFFNQFELVPPIEIFFDIGESHQYTLGLIHQRTARLLWPLNGSKPETAHPSCDPIQSNNVSLLWLQFTCILMRVYAKIETRPGFLVMTAAVIVLERISHMSTAAHMTSKSSAIHSLRAFINTNSTIWLRNAVLLSDTARRRPCSSEEPLYVIRQNLELAVRERQRTTLSFCHFCAGCVCGRRPHLYFC